MCCLKDFQINTTHLSKARTDSTQQQLISAEGEQLLHRLIISMAPAKAVNHFNQSLLHTNILRYCCLLVDLIAEHNLNQFFNKILTEKHFLNALFPRPPKISFCIFYRETVCGSRPSLSRDECNNFQSLCCSKGSPV